MSLHERQEPHTVDRRLWAHIEAQGGYPTCKLNEYCQAKGLPEVLFVSVMKGKPHVPELHVYAQLGQFRASGQGSNKKEAKKR